MIFDIHLATDRLSVNLERGLRDLGYRQDKFINGTAGVIYKHHFSLHPDSKAQCEESWAEVKALLSQTPESDFYGYAEAEVIPPQYIEHIIFKPFDPAVPLPFEALQHEECPLGKQKDFDFHVATDLVTLSPGLQDVLELQLGFYYVDIEKATGKLVRVYTFQPMDVKESPRRYYNALLEYLQLAGGMEGKLKMEATHAYARFPKDARVPPIVTQMPKLANQCIALT